jgi:hypothetical protein
MGCIFNWKPPGERSDNCSICTVREVESWNKIYVYFWAHYYNNQWGLCKVDRMNLKWTRTCHTQCWPTPPKSLQYDINICTHNYMLTGWGVHFLPHHNFKNKSMHSKSQLLCWEKYWKNTQKLSVSMKAHKSEYDQWILITTVCHHGNVWHCDNIHIKHLYLFCVMNDCKTVEGLWHTKRTN